MHLNVEVVRTLLSCNFLSRMPNSSKVSFHPTDSILISKLSSSPLLQSTLESFISKKCSICIFLFSLLQNLQIISDFMSLNFLQQRNFFLELFTGFFTTEGFLHFSLAVCLINVLMVFCSQFNLFLCFCLFFPALDLTSKRSIDTM